MNNKVRFVACFSTVVALMTFGIYIAIAALTVTKSSPQHPNDATFRTIGHDRFGYPIYIYEFDIGKTHYTIVDYNSHALLLDKTQRP